MEYIQFFGGMAIALVSIIVRDAIMKNTFKHKIDSLQNNLTAQETINKAQEARITNNREGMLELRSSMLNLREKFDEFHTVQKEELKSIQGTLVETNQRFASLDATLKGLTKWLERVDSKLDKR